MKYGKVQAAHSEGNILLLVDVKIIPRLCSCHNPHLQWQGWNLQCAGSLNWLCPQPAGLDTSKLSTGAACAGSDVTNPLEDDRADGLGSQDLFTSLLPWRVLCSSAFQVKGQEGSSHSYKGNNKMRGGQDCLLKTNCRLCHQCRYAHKKQEVNNKYMHHCIVTLMVISNI